MLQSIRDRSKGLIAGFIVLLISLTFALFGVGEYINSSARVIVAEVGGEEIDLREFQDSLRRLRRQAQSLLGDSFDSADWGSDVVKQRALDELVNGRLVDQKIADSRIRISDTQLARQIQKIPTFQDENGFSKRLYQQRLPILGFNELAFEEKIRRDLESAQLRAGLAASEFVTTEEAQQVEMLRKQKRDIGYAVIPATGFEDEISASEDEIEAYFDKHRERYRSLEKARFEYLEISPAPLIGEVIVSDELLRAYYEQNKTDYTEVEQRNVNHILIQAPQSADMDADLAARIKIEVARERAVAGESFEELAREISDDTGSKTEGGETGLFPRGVMAPQFEEAAFLLKVGDISEPIRTKFGYHIIKLKEIKPGGLKPFAEIAEEVEEAYRSYQAQTLFIDQAEQFSDLVYEHPDSLEVAAEVLALEVQRTDALSQSEIAIDFSERLAAVAFEPEVLLEGLNSQPVELDDGRVVAIRLVEHLPSVIPPLAEVKEDVTSALRAERMRERTEAAGKEMIRRLSGGETVADVVQSLGFGWEHEEAAMRNSSDVNRAVLRAAFAAEVPGGELVFTGIPIGRGDYAVIRIANVVTPSVDELDGLDIADVKQELIGARTNAIWQEFLQSLRASGDVEIFSDNL